MLAGTRSIGKAAPAPITAVDILDFALNLEYLEAAFYSKATTRMTIDQFGIGISGDANKGAAGPTAGGEQQTAHCGGRDAPWKARDQS